MSFLEATMRFEELYLRAENDPALRAVRDPLLAAKLPSNYFRGRSARVTVSEDESRAKQQQDFDQDIDQIRSGAHLGWLRHLAFIYFGLCSDTDRNLSPRDRLAAWLGEGRVDAALEALAATLSRSDLPSFNDVMALTANHEHYDWWYAALAALNERVAAGRGFAGLSNDFLKGMLVFDIANSVTEHPWRKAMIEQQPQLARDAYLAVAQLRLSHGEQIIDGLRELLQEPAFEADRPAIVLDLLRQYRG
jgi:predicted NACHT family NTPase